MLDHRRLLGAEDVEVGITSELMLRLGAARDRHVQVAWPLGPEDQHGSDIELWVRSRGFRVGFRLQAKALKPRQRIGGVYDELDHVVGKGGPSPREQVDVLIAGTPRPLNAGYLFYNGLATQPKSESACCRDDEWERHNGRLGLTFTTAAHVRHALDNVPFPKRLESILPRSIPLPCLATCVAPTPVEQLILSELLRGRRGLPQGELAGDIFARMPGWVLDALRESDDLWVVAEGTQRAEALLAVLDGLGVGVRVDDGATTGYVDLAFEIGWSQEFADGIPGRDLQGPLVVIDIQ